MRHGIISSCQSAATSEVVKRCCSSLVSSAITSTQTFTFTFIQRYRLQSRSVLSFHVLIFESRKKLGGNDNLRTFFLLLLIIITINAWHDVCFCDAVYGCPDAEAMAQPGYWFKRHGSHQLEVGCTTSDDTWRMKCDGFNWIGDTQRNCSTTGNIQATGTSALFHYFSLVRYCTNYAGLMIE